MALTRKVGRVGAAAVVALVLAPAPVSADPPAPTPVVGPPSPVTARPQLPDELAVASLNVRNLDPSDEPKRFIALADEVVNGMASPDVVVLQGVQDNSGPEPDGTVADDQTISQLIDQISDRAGPAYDWRSIEPVDGADGGEHGGNIRVGFLFRTDRGLGFADRPGDAVTATSVAFDGSLTFNPGRVFPADPAWHETRKPLAGDFTWNGRRVVVVGNHWAAGDNAEQRKAQAKVVASFVKTVKDPVVVAGEFNDTLPIDGLEDLSATLPKDQRYSKAADGRKTATDRILVRKGTKNRDFEYVRWNSGFPWGEGKADPPLARLILE